MVIIGVDLKPGSITTDNINRAMCRCIKASIQQCGDIDHQHLENTITREFLPDDFRFVVQHCPTMTNNVCVNMVMDGAQGPTNIWEFAVEMCDEETLTLNRASF